MVDRSKSGQYLDQYAFAFRQGFAIIVKGDLNSNSQNNNSSNQGTGSNGQFITNLSPQQQLAMYLHMMRGLQDKIMGSSTSNGTNVP